MVVGQDRPGRPQAGAPPDPVPAAGAVRLRAGDTQRSEPALQRSGADHAADGLCHRCNGRGLCHQPAGTRHAADARGAWCWCLPRSRSARRPRDGLGWFAVVVLGLVMLAMATHAPKPSTRPSKHPFRLYRGGAAGDLDAGRRPVGDAQPAEAAEDGAASRAGTHPQAGHARRADRPDEPPPHEELAEHGAAPRLRRAACPACAWSTSTISSASTTSTAMPRVTRCCACSPGRPRRRCARPTCWRAGAARSSW